MFTINGKIAFNKAFMAVGTNIQAGQRYSLINGIRRTSGIKVHCEVAQAGHKYPIELGEALDRIDVPRINLWMAHGPDRLLFFTPQTSTFKDDNEFVQRLSTDFYLVDLIQARNGLKVISVEDEALPDSWQIKPSAISYLQIVQLISTCGGRVPAELRLTFYSMLRTGFLWADAIDVKGQVNQLPLCNNEGHVTYPFKPENFQRIWFKGHEIIDNTLFKIG